MVGWSWVILAGEWIGTAGALGSVLAFLVGGVLISLIGLIYSELVAAIPEAGGEHAYTHRAFGPAVSFICTWAIIFGYVSVVAFEAVALPTVVDYLVPGFRHGYLWQVAGRDIYASWAACGMAAAVIMVVLNVVGIRFAAFLQTLATVIIVGGGLLLISGAALNGSRGGLGPLFGGGESGFFKVLTMVPFMFVGFDVIPQAAEEIDLPFRDIGVVLILAVIMAVVFYVTVITGVSLGLSADVLAGSSLPTADAAASLWRGHWAATLLVLAGLAGILTSWNAFLIGGSRAVYAMARSGMLPAFLGKLSARYDTPANAILLIGALSLAAPLFGRQALIWFVNAGSLGIVVAYALVALAFLRLRRLEPELHRPFYLRGGPLLAWSAFIFAAALAMLYLPGSPSALVWPWEWCPILLWALLGLVLFRCSGID